MTCNRHRAVEDLVTVITDALHARGRAIQSYRGDLEREPVHEAAALAARFIGRPRPARTAVASANGAPAVIDLNGTLRLARDDADARTDTPHSRDGPSASSVDKYISGLIARNSDISD